MVLALNLEEPHKDRTHDMYIAAMRLWGATVLSRREVRKFWWINEAREKITRITHVLVPQQYPTRLYELIEEIEKLNGGNGSAKKKRQRITYHSEYSMGQALHRH